MWDLASKLACLLGASKRLPAAVRAASKALERGDEAAAAHRQDRRFGGGRLHPAGRPGAAPRLGASPRRVGRTAGGALLASTSTALRHRCHPSTAAAQLDSLRSRAGAQPHGLPRPRQPCVSAGGLLHPPLVRAALRLPAAGGRAEEGLRHALPAQRQPLRPLPALRRGEPLRGGDARIPQRAVPVGGGGRGGAPGRPRAAGVGVPAHVEPALQRHRPARAAQPGRARAGGSARRARRPPPGGGHGGAVGARQHAALPGLRQQHHAQLGGAGVGADRAPRGARAQQRTRPRAPFPHRAVGALHEARGHGVARPGAGGSAAVAGADAHGAGAAGGRQPAPGRRPPAGRGGGGAPGGDDDEEEEAEDGVLRAAADAALRPGPDRLHPAAARGVRPRGARVPRRGSALLRLPGGGRGEGAAGAAQGGVLRAAGRAPAAGGERGAGAGVSAQREPAPVGGLLPGRHAGRQGDLLLVPGRAVAALADGYLDRGPRRQHLGFVSHAAGGCRHRALRPLQLEYILAQPVLPPPNRRHGPDGGAHLDARQRRGRRPQARSLQSLADGGAAAGKQQHRLHQRAHRHARLHRRPRQAERNRPAPGLPGRSRRQVHAALALRLDAAAALQLTTDQIRKSVGP